MSTVNPSRYPGPANLARGRLTHSGGGFTGLRWCCWCEVDKPSKGGTTLGGMFKCADCRVPAGIKAPGAHG